MAFKQNILVAKYYILAFCLAEKSVQSRECFESVLCAVINIKVLAQFGCETVGNKGILHFQVFSSVRNQRADRKFIFEIFVFLYFPGPQITHKSLLFLLKSLHIDQPLV